MVDILEAVERGIGKVYTFLDFTGPIKYRAITRREHEEATYEALRSCDDDEIAKILVDYSLARYVPGTDLTTAQYISLRKYQFDLMCNIAHVATKDFQDEDYTVETLEASFVDVIGLAEKVLEASIAPKEEIVKLLKTGSGKLLASIIFKLNVPLVDEAWKMTKLQLNFLINGKLMEVQPGTVPAEEKGKVRITNEMLNENPENVRKQLRAMFGGSKR